MSTGIQLARFLRSQMPRSNTRERTVQRSPHSLSFESVLPSVCLTRHVIRNSPPFCEVSDGLDREVGHSVVSSRLFRTGKLRFCISALTLSGFVFGVNGTRLAALGRLSNGYREKEMRESRIVSISQAVDGLRETFHSLMPSASSSLLCVFFYRARRGYCFSMFASGARREREHAFQLCQVFVM